MRGRGRGILRFPDDRQPSYGRELPQQGVRQPGQVLQPGGYEVWLDCKKPED